MTLQDMLGAAGESKKGDVISNGSSHWSGYCEGKMPSTSLFYRKKILTKKAMCSSLGLHGFYRSWVEVKEITGRPPVVVFESTGHYHEAKKNELKESKD
nr:hypothetical protein [Halobacillus karajensis]